MKRMLFGILALAVVAAQGETDWARLNVAAREHAKTPIRAGVPGVRPFMVGRAPRARRLRARQASPTRRGSCPSRGFPFLPTFGIR